MKKIKATLLFGEDNYDNEQWEKLSFQEIEGLKHPTYNVRDLCMCPEDATIYRDLLSAEQYIEAVEYGIKLGIKGFKGIDVKYEKAKKTYDQFD